MKVGIVLEGDFNVTHGLPKSRTANENAAIGLILTQQERSAFGS